MLKAFLGKNSARDKDFDMYMRDRERMERRRGRGGSHERSLSSADSFIFLPSTGLTASDDGGYPVRLRANTSSGLEESFKENNNNNNLRNNLKKKQISDSVRTRFSASTAVVEDKNSREKSKFISFTEPPSEPAPPPPVPPHRSRLSPQHELITVQTQDAMYDRLQLPGSRYPPIGGYCELVPPAPRPRSTPDYFPPWDIAGVGEVRVGGDGASVSRRHGHHKDVKTGEGGVPRDNSDWDIANSYEQGSDMGTISGWCASGSEWVDVFLFVCLCVCLCVCLSAHTHYMRVCSLSISVCLCVCLYARVCVCYAAVWGHNTETLTHLLPH